MLCQSYEISMHGNCSAEEGVCIVFNVVESKCLQEANINLQDLTLK
jgi:hypothetical protein